MRSGNAAKITAVIIAVVALVAVAFLAGRYSAAKQGADEMAYSVGYAAGYKDAFDNATQGADVARAQAYGTGYNAAWDNATAVIDAIQFPILPQPNETLSIAGAIKGISAAGNVLTVQADPVSTNPLSADSKPTTRSVRITAATRIVKLVAKTPQQIQEALAGNATTALYSEENIPAGQLKNGDRVVITSERNIKRETEITAAKISVQQ
jgi:hypothetical protein